MVSLKPKIILSIVGPSVLGLVSVVFYLSYFEYRPTLREEILGRIAAQVESKASDWSALLSGAVPYGEFRRVLTPFFEANKEVEYLRLHRSQGPAWDHVYGVAVRDTVSLRHKQGASERLGRLAVLGRYHNRWERSRRFVLPLLERGERPEVRTNLPLGIRWDGHVFFRAERQAWEEGTNALNATIRKTEEAYAAVEKGALRPIPEPPLDETTRSLLAGLLARTNLWYSDEVLGPIDLMRPRHKGIGKLGAEFTRTMREKASALAAELRREREPGLRDVYEWRLRRLRRLRRTAEEMVSSLRYIERTLLSAFPVFREEGLDLEGRGGEGRERTVVLYQPVPGKSKAVVEVGVSEDKILGRLEPLVRKAMLPASVFLAAVVLAGLLLSFYLIYPIHVLETGALALRRDKSARIGMGRKDEFGTLAKVLNELSDELVEELRKYETLYVQATEDGLTKLMVRRFFMEVLTRELESGVKEGTPLSLLMTDIDHFKRFNDTYGHQTGDQVHAAVAAKVRENLRRSGIRIDTAGRYGGEEFCVLLPRTGQKEAMEIAERIRRAVEAMEVVLETGERLRVTISVGVATAQGMTDAERLIEAADRGLYASKEGGRNRVSFGGVLGGM